MEFNDKIKKATTHVNQNEGLIFEKSSPGKKAYKLPPLDVPEVDAEALLGDSVREDLGNMPEVSEIEIIRHFTRMSTWNYAVDYGMYPLGSCTMKYNARVNEFAARLARPGQRASLSARAHFAGRVAHHEDAARPAHGNHRHGRHHPAARRRSAWRADRNPAGPRLSRVAGQSAQEDSRSRLRARNQSRDRGDGRIRG